MGATLPFKCPVEGCDYTTSFRLGMGEEEDGAAHAERFALLRKEHPKLPAATAPAITVGEAFPLGASDVGDCPSMHVDSLGFSAACVLDREHRGQHVASDGRNVVEVWD